MGSQAPVFDKYNILFVVGTMDPKIKGVEFISLEELIEQKNIEKISELLNEFMSPDEIQQFNDNLLRKMCIRDRRLSRLLIQRGGHIIPVVDFSKGKRIQRCVDIADNGVNPFF